MKKIVPFLTALFLLCTPVWAEEKDFLGEPFPDFTVTDSAGETFTLSEALKDHEAVLVNFWATWCPPCEAEFPYLSEAYEQLGDRAAFISLSTEPNDTPEKIEEYRKSHDIPFSLGRDEGTELYRTLNEQSIPVTVIVDRFGNAVFSHTGSFLNTGEVTRTLEAVLGDDYTESAVITEIPKEDSTAMFPVSSARAIYVENEGARPVTFRFAGSTNTLDAYVIEEDTAHLRFEIEASANPTALVYYDGGSGTFLQIPELLDSEKNIYVYDQPIPDSPEDDYYTFGALLKSDLSDDENALDLYIIRGEDHLDTFAGMLSTETGMEASWEYDEAAPEESASPEQYILHVIDQNGTPVPEVFVNFCTDTACTSLESDSEGVITFDGEPAVYHIQLIEAPDGYSFDEDFDLYTDDVYGEWSLRIRKEE